MHIYHPEAILIMALFGIGVASLGMLFSRKFGRMMAWGPKSDDPDEQRAYWERWERTYKRSTFIACVIALLLSLLVGVLFALIKNP